MSGSDQRLTVPQVARILGISERGVRDKIEHGTLRAEKEGKRWIVFLPAEDAVVRGSTRGSGAVVGGDRNPTPRDQGSDTTLPGTHDNAMASPAEVERAIARTGQQYTADLRTILGELREVYEGQLAAKDETIATKDQALAMQQETIAELRRRAEAAEVEREALRLEVDDLLSLAASAPPHEAATNTAPVDTPAPPAPSAGFWARVRRAFGGE